MMSRRPKHDPEGNATAYVSGEFPRKFVQWFETHLLECEDCWGEVFFARRGRMMAQRGWEPVPASVRDNVRALVAAASSSSEGHPRRLFRWNGR